MKILHNQTLRPYNTLGFSQTAEYFAELDGSDDALAALDFCRTKKCPITVVGDGSNLVITDNIPGLTVRMTNQSVTRTIESGQHRVCVDSGLNWDQFVGSMVDAGAYGLENLSLIPGTVGAAPVQNIGAYGVEIADTIESVSCIDLDDRQACELAAAECGFAYRDSVFKRSSPIAEQTPLRGAHTPRFLITAVTFRLATTFEPQLSYKALQLYAEQHSMPTSSANDMRQLVIAVRSSKLPDPASLGNAGSFFKNPELTAQQATEFRKNWPDAPCHEMPEGLFKIAAGWLIEKAGWRGFTDASGEVGVYEKQALVLVNYHSSRADKLVKLADEIRISVDDKFGITLEQEPRSIP